MTSNAKGVCILIAVAAGVVGPTTGGLSSLLDIGQALASPRLTTKATADGERLFERETFGGNGRTCGTCHRPQDGFSTTPASAQARLAADPADPLVRPIDSDDGVGRQYARLLTHATVRVKVPLKCRNIWPEADPKASSIVVNRGIPGLLDMPALDPI